MSCKGPVARIANKGESLWRVGQGSQGEGWGAKAHRGLIVETCNPSWTLASILRETGEPQQGSEHKRVMRCVAFWGLSLAARLDHTVKGQC